MARPVVITSVPEAPDAERHRREVAYTVMMLIRTACFIGMIFAPGWWRLLLFLGALFLPYLAVVRANVPFAPRRVLPEAPIDRELPASSPSDRAQGHDPESGTGA